MAIGDDAAAAGFALVADSDLASLGYQEINRTRDYVAQAKSLIPASYPEIAALKFTATPRSNNVFADDPQLVLNLLPSSKYLITCSIIYEGTSGMDYTFTVPSGVTGGYANSFALWGEPDLTQGYVWSQVNRATTSGALDLGMIIQGALKTDTSGGTFAFRWRNHTFGDLITVGSGCTLLAKKIP